MIETLLRRDRLIVTAGLVILFLLAAAWTLSGAGLGMSGAAAPMDMDMDMGAKAPASHWSPGRSALLLAMWWVMMIAMMTPSAAPMILLFARVSRQTAAQSSLASSPLAHTAAFLTGYLLIWLAFSLLATTLQATLEGLGLVAAMSMWSANRLLSASVLAAAGIYQLTPLKNSCLLHCRAPAAFLTSHWRPGASGALQLGLRHGAWCVGCCWALMALLFVGGVMNPVWIAAIAILVLLEKLAPAGALLSRVSGVVLIGWAAATLLAG